MPSILVVDDDRAVQDMLITLLSDAGYKVETCRDGKQVLVELSRKSYDLLILDILIPHMNGFMLLDQLRADPKFRELPIILISGIYRSRNHRVDMTMRHRIVDYLDKPLDVDKLLQIIAKTFGGESSESEPNEPAGAPAVKSTLAKELPSDSELDSLLQEYSGPPRKSPPPPPENIETADVEMLASSVREERREIENEARETFSPSAFLLQGSLKNTPLAAVLGQLWSKQASGALLLRREKVKKIIYLNDGHPYFVKSNLVNECLGQVLLRERLITVQECEESLRRVKKSGQRQGEILVQMGCITERNLTFALELQLETKLFECFQWAQGEFRYNALAPPVSSRVRLEWQAPGIIAEGLRRHYDETRLRELMLPVLDVALVSSGKEADLRAMRLSAREAQAIEAMILPQTTRQLLDSMPLDPPDTLRVIYTLIALEILQPAKK